MACEARVILFHFEQRAAEQSNEIVPHNFSVITLACPTSYTYIVNRLIACSPVTSLGRGQSNGGEEREEAGLQSLSVLVDMQVLSCAL